MNSRKGLANMSVLIFAALAVGVVILFGSALFYQAINNAGLPVANYPLAQQAANFNATMTNFTGSFITSTNAATATQTNVNPLTSIASIGAGVASVIGIVWQIMGLLMAIITTGGASLIVAGIIPAWLPGVGLFALALLFGFAAIAYLIRWFA